MVNALPTILNKKHFKKLTHEKTVEKLDQIYKHFHMVLDLKNKVSTRSVILNDIEVAFDQLISERPCALVRLAMERTAFVENDD